MKTLVLNVNFQPLNIISSKRAIILSSKNNIKVIGYYEHYYKSEKDAYKVPAVILYEKYVNLKVRNKPTKKQILIRDRMKCQYCSIDLCSKIATIDHIKPISFHKKREDSNSWCNMVACCKQCNMHKKMRTPEQAGMKLLKLPKKPTGFLVNEEIPEEWRSFIKDV